MKGKENVCQQRRPGINLRGFSSRISSTADISSLFDNLPEFILKRADERLRLGRRNLLAVAKRTSRQHDRRRRRASPNRISFLVPFAPSACRRNEGARIRFVEKSSILVSIVEIFRNRNVQLEIFEVHYRVRSVPPPIRCHQVENQR